MRTTPTPIAIAALAATVSLAACGGGQSDCGPGRDLVPAIIGDSQLDTFQVASLGVDELRIVGSGAEHNTLVQAHFSDFSEYQVQLAERTEFPDHPACMLYTSRPVTSGEPIPLHVDRATFGGLAGGEVVLEPNANEHLPTDLLPQRGFDAATVTIEIESPGGQGDFPAFSDEIPAPAQPVLLAIGDLTDPDLAAGPSLGIATDRTDHMRVKWEPAGSDYVEIKLLPGAGSATPWGKLRCITFDDGCLEIPAAALSQLAMDEAVNFDFRIEHHFFVIHPIGQGAQPEASALIDTSSTLQGTVVR